MQVLLALLWNIVRLPLLPLFFLAKMAQKKRAKSWVHLKLRRQVSEYTPPSPKLLRRLMPGIDERQPTSLARLRSLRDTISADPKVEGLVVQMPMMGIGWASARAIRELFLELKKEGKQVAVFLPDGATHKELYIASAANRVFAPHGVTFACVGLAAHGFFFRELLDSLGIELDVFRRAEFKSAMERFTRDEMSEAQKEQSGALLELLDGLIRDALQNGRHLDNDAIDAIFARGMASAPRALESGMIDAVLYEDELATALTAGDENDEAFVGAGEYLALKHARFFRPLRKKDYIAVVSIEGTISPGASANKVSESLRAIRKSKRAKGLVLHIDSPGGAVSTSEKLRREVELVARKMPVLAHFGDVAASGGYYIATSCHEIIASPETITGSIGVISARPNLSRALQRLKIHSDTLSIHPRADILRNPRPLTDDERETFDEDVGDMYSRFVELVAAARKRSVEEVEPLCRGRVYSGHHAKELGLLDDLGGMQSALDRVRIMANVSETVKARHIQAPKSIVEALRGGARSLAVETRSQAGAWALATDISDIR